MATPAAITAAADVTTIAAAAAESVGAS